MLKIGVLASGRGTNLQSIIDSIQRGDLKIEIRIVISDRKGAKALSRASKYHIPNQYINPDDYATKEEFEQAMINLLDEHKVELVILAGFMRLLTPYFVRHYKNKIMNIHPSLLPAFPGLNAQRQALEYGVKIAGCTVHFVDEGMDTGPIILQAAVPVKEGDTEETLAERILQKEHRIYPEAIRLYSEGRLKIEGRVVKVVE